MRRKKKNYSILQEEKFYRKFLVFCRKWKLIFFEILTAHSLHALLFSLRSTSIARAILQKLLVIFLIFKEKTNISIRISFCETDSSQILLFAGSLKFSNRYYKAFFHNGSGNN